LPAFFALAHLAFINAAIFALAAADILHFRTPMAGNHGFVFLARPSRILKTWNATCCICPS